MLTSTWSSPWWPAVQAQASCRFPLSPTTADQHAVPSSKGAAFLAAQTSLLGGLQAKGCAALKTDHFPLSTNTRNVYRRYYERLEEANSQIMNCAGLLNGLVNRWVYQAFLDS